MNTLRLPSLLCGALLFVSLVAHAQHPYSDAGQAVASSEANKTPAADLNPYRFHKKLPALYNGYAIEVIASNYPLDRTNPIFHQFGNIHYDKLERGGFSYLILTRFTSDEPAQRFLKNIIIPKARDARLIFYNDGIRKVVREE